MENIFAFLSNFTLMTSIKPSSYNVCKIELNKYWNIEKKSLKCKKTKGNANYAISILAQIFILL